MVKVRLSTDTTPTIDRDTFNRLCPPYKVLLHNDDVNSMDYVVVALLKSVPSLDEEEAVKIMLTANDEGVALVCVCPQETAEYYQERILSFNINATIEPDE
jgi:ATP-dependent Clp protease adaptor protein ClpS